MDYSKALQELEKTVADIENGDIMVDELTARVKRATELIKICKKALADTEDRVNEVLSDLSEGKNAKE